MTGRAKITYLPHNHIENCIVYTGTHDNNTTRGWFEKDVTVEQKKNLYEYLGHRVSKNNIAIELIRMAMASAANTAIIPMQDILGLGAEARMNHPAKIIGNWQWRMKKNQINNTLADRMAKLTQLYGRQ